MVTLESIKIAYSIIEKYVHVTPVLTSTRLNRLIGAELFFKAENFQKVGAFKFRGAINTLSNLLETTSVREVVTHSSGNHAQALSLAAKILGFTAHIVMPETSTKVKVNAVKAYGGIVYFCKPSLQSREELANEILRKTSAGYVHPYNDYRIIAGQGTCALEFLLQLSNHPDIIIAPVGGGGLLSGTSIAVKEIDKNIKVLGAEPLGADDARRSLKAGYIIPQTNPQTIADGLLTSLGDKTFSIISKYTDDILVCSEKAIYTAMQLIYENLKIVVEPSAAVPLACVLENKALFKDKRVGIIVSGGNIDITNFKWRV